VRIGDEVAATHYFVPSQTPKPNLNASLHGILGFLHSLSNLSGLQDIFREQDLIGNPG
jgi:hypothetical protein